MRGNFLKTIFLILIIIIIAYFFYGKISNNDSIIQAGKFEPSNNKETVRSNNIRIGIIEFDNINPILSNNKNVQDISRLIFEPLFSLTEEYKLDPKLATEWTKLDDTTYIIKLRENVKWQDGNKFDSSDVIFTIDMLKKEENNSIYRYNVENIVELEEIDEYTIRIKINEKIPYFEYNLIFPIVSSKYYNEENFIKESKNIKPVGTGVLYISDVTNDSILLKKNVSHWNNRKIKLDSVNLNLYSSLSNVINAFKSGEVDIFTTSNKNIDEYLKKVSYIKKEYINRKYDYISLNCSDYVLSNKEVRQAINSAINKEDILKKVYSNKYRISNFPLDFGSYVYDTNNTVIKDDKNIAKGLLIDNGWSYSYKKWRKTVNYRYLTIDLNLLVNKNNSKLVKVAKNIKEQLESVGININIIEADNNQYNRYLQNQNYDLVLKSANYSYSPTLNKYFKDGNISNYNNEEITSILNEVENITDENEIKHKYTRIMEIYNEDVPYISLYYDTNTCIYSNNLKGNINPNSYNLFYGIEEWYREYKK